MMIIIFLTVAYVFGEKMPFDIWNVNGSFPKRNTHTQWKLLFLKNQTLKPPNVALKTYKEWIKKCIDKKKKWTKYWSEYPETVALEPQCCPNPASSIWWHHYRWVWPGFSVPLDPSPVYNITPGHAGRERELFLCSPPPIYRSCITGNKRETPETAFSHLSLIPKENVLFQVRPSQNTCS